MDVYAILRLVASVAFLIEFCAYAILAYVRSAPRYHALNEVLYDNMIVTGLNAFLYAYLANSGELQYIWLVYPFSCVFLAISFYRVLTYDVVAYKHEDAVSDVERHPPYTYYQMAISVFLTLISGYVINQLQDISFRIAVFVLAFIPFVFLVMFLFKAIDMVNRGQNVAKTWIRVVIYITLVFWVGYPIVMLLGPLFTNAISVQEEGLGYLLLDIVTKHINMAILAAYMATESAKRCTEHSLVENKNRPVMRI